MNEFNPEEEINEFSLPEGMSVLDVILKNPNFNRKTEDFFEVKRLGVSIKLRALSGDEYEECVSQSMEVKRVRRGSPQTETVQNPAKFKINILEKGIIDPNFNDPEVRRRISRQAVGNETRNTVEDCLKFMFNPGEMEKISIQIMELSGFGDDESVIAALKEK